MYDLDTFVERVLMHNNVVTREQVDEARKIAQEYAGSNLLDGLIHVGALDASKARGIFEDFRRWSARQSQAMPASQISEPPPPPRPAPPPPTPQERERLNTTRREVPQPRIAAPAAADSSKDSAELSQELTIRLTAASVNKSTDKSTQINQYLNYARKLEGSDLHIKPGMPLAIRKHGQLLQFDLPAFTPKQTEAVLFSVLNEDQQRQLQDDRSIEFSYFVEGLGRYRVCLLRSRLGWEGTFRCLQSKIPTFEQLGLPNYLTRLTDYHQGLVLITGPSGSGKSTTLAAMVDLVNQRRPVHIITIEDPIEYVFRPHVAQVNQREVGLHTESFALALRGALRQDPDVIMIGELRDLNTISLAITASETGHLVFGTLDTTSAPRTINRLLEVFPPDEQAQIRRMISESIRGIVCQQLIPRKDKQGQALALEILFNTPAVGNLIRDAKLNQIQPLMLMGRNLGMVTMDDSLQTLLDADIIEGVEAYFAAIDKTRFEHFSPLAF